MNREAVWLAARFVPFLLSSMLLNVRERIQEISYLLYLLIGVCLAVLIERLAAVIDREALVAAGCFACVIVRIVHRYNLEHLRDMGKMMLFRMSTIRKGCTGFRKKVTVTLPKLFQFW